MLGDKAPRTARVHGRWGQVGTPPCPASEWGTSPTSSGSRVSPAAEVSQEGRLLAAEQAKGCPCHPPTLPCVQQRHPASVTAPARGAWCPRASAPPREADRRLRGRCVKVLGSPAPGQHPCQATHMWTVHTLRPPAGKSLFLPILGTHGHTRVSTPPKSRENQQQTPREMERSHENQITGEGHARGTPGNPPCVVQTGGQTSTGGS